MSPAHPLIQLPVPAPFLSPSGQAEIPALVERINCGDDKWSATASKLRGYAAALTRHLPDQDPLLAIEIGAGITYLFNFLLLKSLFPGRPLRFIAIDTDPLAAAKHRRTCRGRDITYLTADAADPAIVGRLTGLENRPADCVFLDRPVIWQPQDYRDHLPESAPMRQALRDPDYEGQLGRQCADFQAILHHTLPAVLRPGGLILASCLLPDEFPALRGCLSDARFSAFHSCLFHDP